MRHLTEMFFSKQIKVLNNLHRGKYFTVFAHLLSLEFEADVRGFDSIQKTHTSA